MDPVNPSNTIDLATKFVILHPKGTSTRHVDDIISVKWTPPREGVTKLNTNGLPHTHQGLEALEGPLETITVDGSWAMPYQLLISQVWKLK